MSLESIISLASLVWLVGSGIIGYWVNGISTNQREINKTVGKIITDLKNVEVMIPNEYVKKEDINARLDKIDAFLDRIYDRLEQKADK